MPINTETLNRKLYNKLSKYSPKPLDSSGKVTPVEDDADVFKFKFTMDGKEYGDVFATVDDERRLILYYGDDVGDSPETPTPGIGYNDTWLGFVEDLKSWKTRNGFKGWQLKNQDQLAPDMARRNHMKKKDNLGEAYYPMGKKASYSDSVPTIKMVIQHTRQIEEGEQRYRNIAKIFLENQDGERFLAPTLKPGIARVYARHIAEGGKPHDERWNHIGSLCEEYQKMAGFVRATRGQQFNESAQQLVESGIQHYYTLRESLSKMTGHRGYNAYFESWTPPLMEDDSEGENINELFVQETVDPRIESVMPILSRLHKKVAETKIDRELNQLAEWAESLDQDLEEDDGMQSNNPVGIPEDEEVEENFINMVPQAVAEGLDDTQRARLDDLIDKYKDSVDPEAYYGLNDEYPDSDEVIAQIRQEFGDKIADTVEAGAGKMHFPRDNHSFDIDPLQRKMSPRVTKSGKINKQDNDYMKREIKRRIGIGEEGEVQTFEEVDESDYPDGSSIKPPSKQEWQQQYQQAVMAVKNAKTQQEYEAASERAGHIKDLLASKGIKVGPALEQSVAEELDANQKRVGQLGPTEKVKNNNIGKLVGANESKINEMDKSQKGAPGWNISDDESGGKEHYVKAAKPKDVVKKGEKALNKAMDKAHKKDVKEGQEDLDAILRIIRK